MRILLYGYEYPPLGGGVGNALKKLFEQFSKYDDLHIDFVTTSLNNKLEIEEVYPNITFYRLPLGVRTPQNYHKQKPLQMLLFWWKAYIRTWRLVFKYKYDASHFFGFPGGLVSLLFRWRMPYFISLRGVDVPGYNPRFKKLYIFYKPLSWLIWKFAKKVIPNSQGLFELAQNTAVKVNYEIIPNGIDTNSFKPVAESKKFKTFTITQGGTLFGKKKGLEYLIRGFALFHEKYSDSKLLMIGSGDLEDDFKQLVKELNIEKSVEFTGFQENSWVSENLPKCHVFCLPSLNEGMSNAALEALASGLPLILTNTGGTRELLSNNNGIIVQKENPEEIANAIETLYSDEKLRKNIGKRSRERSLEMSWESVAKQYYDIYQSVKK